MTTKAIRYRRKRSGQTDYKARRYLLSSRKFRIVIRRSLRHVQVQIIQYKPEGDRVLVSADSKELRKLGWNFGLKNTPACYLTGLLLAKKAKEKKLAEGVVDLGRYSTTRGNKLFAVVKGMADGGLQVPVPEKACPSKDRLEGKHIAGFVDKSVAQQFSTYKKNNISLTSIKEKVAEVVKKIQ
ncbi:50S ribosomal protein L18 [Candidatus Woesearchaeota archaeon]|nr:50S ribosomal protein L18 [Candidatus Woesearchaeota archaeon]